ncbi:MAG: hypothetical protein M3065_14240 [Actinomycetota bacterium]|nr:hypothetical protein [Actinomycetota bacterium]
MSARYGYDDVAVELIAEESWGSLRTFYRYFCGQHEVLSPIMAQGIAHFAAVVAERPAEEDLSTAVKRAYEQQSSGARESGSARWRNYLACKPTCRP